MKKEQNKRQSVSEAVNAFNWKRALILLVSTAFAMGLYFFLMNIYSLCILGVDVSANMRTLFYASNTKLIAMTAIPATNP